MTQPTPINNLTELEKQIAEQIGLIARLDLATNQEALLNRPIAELIRDSLDLLDLGLQIETVTGIEVKQEHLNNRLNAKELAQLLLCP
jgi:acyl carrier protein